jgi:hypothetical protein
VGVDRAADEAPSVDFVLARKGKDFVLLIMLGFAFSQ